MDGIDEAKEEKKNQKREEETEREEGFGAFVGSGLTKRDEGSRREREGQERSLPRKHTHKRRQVK